MKMNEHDLQDFSNNWVIIEEPIKPYYPKFLDFTPKQLEGAKDIEIIILNKKWIKQSCIY